MMTIAKLLIGLERHGRRMARVACAASVCASLGMATAAAAVRSNDTMPTVAATSASVPDGVPLDFVVTPNGYFHPSCVHQIDSDEKLRADGSVERADGSLDRPAPCAYPRFNAQGQRIEPPVFVPADDANPGPDGYVRGDTLFTGTFDFFNGYVEAATHVLPVAQAVSVLSARFVVPAAPTRRSGQTIYLFPGVEYVEAVRTILQPVLGWNAFNDNTWTVASWNCCVDGSTNHSTPLATAAGHTILGTMTGTGCNASTHVCADWSIVSRDEQAQQATTLNTVAYEQPFDWLFAGALEVYGVTRCDEFPADRSVRFSSVDATSISPVSHVALSWDVSRPSSIVACNYRITVANPGQHAGDVTLYY